MLDMEVESCIMVSKVGDCLLPQKRIYTMTTATLTRKQIPYYTMANRYKERNGWALITEDGEFAEYWTKAEALKDAKKYGIKIK